MKTLEILVIMAAVVSPLCLPGAHAGGPTPGPVIEAYGAVYDVDEPAHVADPKRGIRAVFDVGAAPRERGKVHGGIDTVARFLNLHARAGFPRNKVKAALVLHGAATDSALNDAAYRERHGATNPDLELLARLRAAGVRVYLCGQSAAHRGIARKELSKDVDLALSAMTALGQLQAEGYALIAF